MRTLERNQLVEITGELRRLVAESGVEEGLLVAQSLHTTAALTVNESADPDVPGDIAAKLSQLIPHREPFYRHAEGNSDSHVKVSLLGPSLTLLVSGGELVLGSWQGVFLCEFDGPRERRVAVRVAHSGASSPA